MPRAKTPAVAPAAPAAKPGKSAAPAPFPKPPAGTEADAGLITDVASELGISQLMAPQAGEAAELEEIETPEGETAETPETPEIPEQPGDEPETPVVAEPETPDETASTTAPDPMADMQARLEALQNEVTALRTPPATPPTQALTPPLRTILPGENILLAAETPEQLDAVTARYEAVIERCYSEPDGWEQPSATANGEPVVIDRAQVGKLLVEANRVLRHVPQRQQEIAEFQRGAVQAREIYPEFAKPNSEESRTLQQILRLAPQLKRLPNLHALVGDAIAGEHARLKPKAAALAVRKGPDGKPLPGAEVKKPVAKPPTIVAAPARAPSATAAAEVNKTRKLWQQAATTGGPRAVEALVENMLSAQSARRAG